MSAEREQALREYGFNLGIAFQLVDDLLDFTGDSQARRQADRRRSARRQDDAAAHPPAAAAAGAAAPQIVRDIIASRTVDEEQWGELLRALKEHARSTTRTARAVEFAERAKKPLYAFPPSSERDALLALPDYVLVPGPLIAIARTAITLEIARRPPRAEPTGAITVARTP